MFIVSLFCAILSAVLLYVLSHLILSKIIWGVGTIIIPFCRWFIWHSDKLNNLVQTCKDFQLYTVKFQGVTYFLLLIDILWAFIISVIILLITQPSNIREQNYTDILLWLYLVSQNINVKLLYLVLQLISFYVGILLENQ